MSTDLQFRPEFSPIRLPTIRITPPCVTESAGGEIHTPKNRHQVNGVEEEFGCRTPTSRRHKIPAILSCPPAPRKAARRTASCKRKLFELDFFEVVGREEIESFFRSNSNSNSSAVVKRKCPCPCP